MKKKIPQGVRKHIRKKKSFIRKEVLDVKKRKETITSLYKLLQNKK